jgi:baseplate hub protein gp41
MSFVRRKIDVTITLGEGKFGDTAGNAITLTGLRVIAHINAMGGDAQGQLQLTVFGLPLDMINQLTSIGPVATQVRRQNTVQVAAGDDGAAMTTVYEGVIDSAYGDFQNAPDVALHLTAMSALGAAIVPVNATSWKGSISVDSMMSTFAATIGFAYENNGVDAVLTNAYFPGTALSQIRACAQAANIRYSTDNGILAIWPKTGQRDGDIPVLSAAGDMVGYPIFSSSGVTVNSLFIPNIKQGGQVTIDSEIQVACGTWRIASLAHALESERPGGAWFTQLNCYNKNG